ncbi:BON domain-containing protein [Pedobacter sp. ASV12]|uniref:BON domain-containing protein n=1 Tax=Pedobacter sp. ASV12 TaxID=2795120 RepID=UPI0018EB2BEB|nr:BON domain-containing protein [Pedobacter sp. ASV12]
MKSDAEIQKDVLAELKWQPSLSSAEIGVAVKNGVVTLSGQVESFIKKATAERAAKNIAGVKAVAEDIEVRMPAKSAKSDTEIAMAILRALEWNSAVQHERIKIKVENGVVRLDGEAEWDFQRTQAKKAIEKLAGVKTVLNFITLKPHAEPVDIQQKIEAAFKRSATVDSKKVSVDVIGSKVVLHGKVRSFAEKQDAENAAWAAPGVLAIDNQLEIEVPEMIF